LHFLHEYFSLEYPRVNAHEIYRCGRGLPACESSGEDEGLPEAVLAASPLEAALELRLAQRAVDVGDLDGAVAFEGPVAVFPAEVSPYPAGALHGASYPAFFTSSHMGKLSIVKY